MIKVMTPHSKSTGPGIVCTAQVRVGGLKEIDMKLN